MIAPSHDRTQRQPDPQSPPQEAGVREGLPFQKRVINWLMECFSMEICRDTVERNHRFLEEAIELVQSLGCTASEAHQLVDYVYGRPVGEPKQEAGGVMVTLAALCYAADLDMRDAGETELARVWTKIDKIRAKQAAKPKHSPLPEASPAAPSVQSILDYVDELDRYGTIATVVAVELRRKLRTLTPAIGGDAGACILCCNGNDMPEGEFCAACGREGRAFGLGAAVIKARGRQVPPKRPVMFDGPVEQTPPASSPHDGVRDQMIICVAAECSAACLERDCPYSHFPGWKIIGSNILYETKEEARAALSTLGEG